MEEFLYVAAPESELTAWSPDGRQQTQLGPPAHGLDGDREDRGHLGAGEKFALFVRQRSVQDTSDLMR
jgi:hypothetical protein